MTRATGLITLLLCAGSIVYPVHGQQTPLPAIPVGASDDQAPAQPAATETPGSVPASETPAPAPSIDPRTGLPLTPVDQREKEIDKYDPMKRNTDPTAKDLDPLLDRRQPGTTANANDGTASATKTGATAASQFGAKSAQDPEDDSPADSTETGGGYTGPAVLSRSYTLARPMIPRQIKWRTSLGFNYSFNEGQAPAAGSADTTDFQSTTSEGRSFFWSAAGRHIWKHDQLGLSYTGSYSNYSTSSLSGTNNSLNLDYSHVVSRRLSFQVVESVQDYSQNYSLQNPVLDSSTSIANINLATSPTVLLLNNTTRQSSTTGSMTYRQTARLSYSASSSYFVTGRTQGVGLTGHQVGADLNYRWTRKATVGAYYSYTGYLYSHNISSSDSHGLGVIFSYALNRSTQLQTRFGATRIEGLGYEMVALPPVLAAILGQGASLINAYSLHWTSDISVQLVRDLRRGRVGTLAYAHGESPGNGVLLTSVQQTISGGYSMSLLRRRVPLNVGVVYSSLQSTMQGNLGYYKSETAYVSTSRVLGRGVNGTFSVNYLRYDVSGTSLLQHTLSISLGVSWSPPDNLMRF